MSKKLKINCGTALLLRNKPEVFEGYDEVWINTGSIVISSKLQAFLKSFAMKLNAGSTSYIRVDGEVVDIFENGIDTNADYAGNYLLAHQNIVIYEAHDKALQTAQGMYVCGNLYYSDANDTTIIARINAQKTIMYPQNAKVIIGNKELNDDILREAEGCTLWIDGCLEATDRQSLELAKKNGISFISSELFITQELFDEFETLFKTKNKYIVPSGYAIVDKLTLNALIVAQYGDKIFVRGDLKIKGDLRGLENVTSVIVQGKATIPLECLDLFKQKCRAQKLEIYEGELIEINGKETMTHARLAAANELGIKSTIVCNGELMFDETVLGADLECIASVSYNGTITMPGRLIPLLNRKVKSANGNMVDSDKKSEKNQYISEESSDTCINTGTYVL